MFQRFLLLQEAKIQWLSLTEKKEDFLLYSLYLVFLYIHDIHNQTNSTVFLF